MDGKELKERRIKLGLSQAALAQKLSTTQNTISRWELETVTIEKPEMLRLAIRQLERETK